jgi:deoxycytidine triphosphate deaminase
MGEYNKSNAHNTYCDCNIPPGMLSSPQIAYCVEKFDIIKNYKDSCLGPATYHMRIGNEVLTWDKGEKKEFILGAEEDKNKNIYNSIELKPNSLTFVTTIEEFNLPKDIIARFNLKSKWVHQGLLLGTGPIVDPELQARLLIPVHNFSSNPVRMNFDDEFISVEFTKTSNPDMEFELTEKHKARYRNNAKWNFNFHKYRERIGNKPVESSVQSQFQTYGIAIEYYKKTNQDLEKKHNEFIKKYTTYNFIGYLSVILVAVALVITTWQLIHSAHEKIDIGNKIINEYLTSQPKTDDLQKQLLKLTEDIEKLQKNVQLAPQTDQKLKKR